MVERLKDRIWNAIYNLPLDATDERRAQAAAEAVMCEGEHLDLPDHGSWADTATHN